MRMRVPVEGAAAPRVVHDTWAQHPRILKFVGQAQRCMRRRAAGGADVKSAGARTYQSGKQMPSRVISGNPRAMPRRIWSGHSVAALVNVPPRSWVARRPQLPCGAQVVLACATSGICSFGSQSWHIVPTRLCASGIIWRVVLLAFMSRPNTAGAGPPSVSRGGRLVLDAAVTGAQPLQPPARTCEHSFFSAGHSPISSASGPGSLQVQLRVIVLIVEPSLPCGCRLLARLRRSFVHNSRG